MSVPEYIVEDDVLDWFGEPGYAFGHGARALDGMDRMDGRNGALRP